MFELFALFNFVSAAPPQQSFSAQAQPPIVVVVAQGQEKTVWGPWEVYKFDPIGQTWLVRKLKSGPKYKGWGDCQIARGVFSLREGWQPEEVAEGEPKWANGHLHADGKTCEVGPPR